MGKPGEHRKSMQADAHGKAIVGVMHQQTLQENIKHITGHDCLYERYQGVPGSARASQIIVYCQEAVVPKLKFP